MSSGVTNSYYQPNGVYYTTPGQFTQLQGQVNDVTEIMRNNIRLGLERGANLDEVEMRAEELNNSAQQFSYSAQRVRKKFWWKNVQMWIIIIIVVVIVLILIIVLSVLAAKNKI